MAYRQRSGMKAGISVLLAVVAFGGACSAKATTPCPAVCSCKILVYFHHVNCSNAGLTGLPKNLNENTTNLLFSDNRLSFLRNNTFEKLSKILQLYLDHNLISFIEGATFWNLDELRALFLNHNLLQDISREAFINNKQLQFLDLSGNMLLIPESGGLLKSSSVTQLTLTECNFNYLPPDMFDKTLSLTKLDLKSNKIESPSVETFKALTHLKNLSLEGNNINCNCDIVGFYNWADAKKDFTIRVECNSESMIWNKVSSLDCSNVSLLTWIGVGAGVLLLLVLVAVFTCYVLRRRKQSSKPRIRRPPLPSVPAGPAGEYIEVVAEKTYESIRATQVARYMASPTAPEAPDGPIYVNAFVPPSAPKSRRDRVPTYDDVRPPSLTPSATKMDAKTRCMSLASILKDCDYYETVD